MISTTLNSMAELLAGKLNSGQAARETLTGSTNSVAFSWLTGLPSVLARFVTTAQVDGLSFNGIRIKPSPTPVVKVTEGSPKPAAVVLESFSTSLSKYAGVSTFSLEQSITTAALLPAISASLVHQSLVAFDTDAVAQLDADHGLEVTAADWTNAALEGIGAVAGGGGNPNLLVVSPADYSAAVQSPAAVFSADLTNGVTALFGLQLAVLIGAQPGVGYVLDSSAVTCIEHVNSPLITVDPYSLSDTNRTRLVSDLIAGTVVTSPGSVAQLTVTPVAGTRGGGGKRSDFVLGS